jgi:fluoride exporter
MRWEFFVPGASSTESSTVNDPHNSERLGAQRQRERALSERRTIAAVACGAALGGVCRLLVTQAVESHAGAAFGPYATLLINLSGSFLLGMVLELARSDAGLQPFWKLFLTTGLISGYTTFSAFAYDALHLATQGFALGAVLYALGSVGLGITALCAGVAATRAGAMFAAARVPEPESGR